MSNFISKANLSAFATKLADALRTKFAEKQDTLTFDTTPTASSTNPVTSGGVRTALNAKQDALNAGDGIQISASGASAGYDIKVDATDEIISGSTLPVSSGAVYTAIGNIETLLASI